MKSKKYFDNSGIIVDRYDLGPYHKAMEIKKAAKCIAELGNPSRLSAFRLLVRAGPDGLPVKDIRAHLDIPQSTLSHHLSHLMSAGLVTQTREGRILRCRVDYDRIQEVLTFLMEDCCAGISVPRCG